MKKLLTILPILLLAACGHESGPPQNATAPASSAPPPSVALPTKDEAAAVIRESAEFGDFQFTFSSFSLPVQRSMMNAPALAGAQELKDAGWIAFDGSGNAVLTAKSKDDRRFLVRPNGFIDIVPLAKKEFGEVASVERTTDGNAAVEFSWRWIPNEVGSAFKSGLIKERFSTDHKARATLMQDGGKWTVLLIEPK
jgi:hypothetical protein